MKSPSADEYASPREAGRSVVEYVRDAFIGGLAVVVPFVVTVIVLTTIVQYVVKYLGAILGAAPEQEATPVMFAASVAFLLLLVFFVGFLTQFRYGETFIDYVDAVLSQVPGFGAVYESFREMSDVMMESDEKSFRDVKLVEFPHEGAYTLGFLTASSAPALKDAADRQDLVTLFLPLAPNPVMGGHLVHVPEERVIDVDMTVDEGIRTIVTSGVATGDDGNGHGSSLSAEELERLTVSSETAVGTVESGPGADDQDRQEPTVDPEARERAYEEHAAPDGPDEESVPSAVEAYREEGTLGSMQDNPDEVENDGYGGHLGSAQDSPDDVERDAQHEDFGVQDHPGDVEERGRRGTLGDDHDTPADLADRRDPSSLGNDHDTPSDVTDAAAADDRWRSDRSNSDDRRRRDERSDEGQPRSDEGRPRCDEGRPRSDEARRRSDEERDDETSERR